MGMHTGYDWITLALFAGLVALFVNRARERGAPSGADLAHYLVAAVGCAVVNYLGNKNMHVAAIALLAGTGAYVWVCVFDLGVHRG
jgi:hypothetical protein